MTVFIFALEENVTRGWEMVAGQAALSAPLHTGSSELIQAWMGKTNHNNQIGHAWGLGVC